MLMTVKKAIPRSECKNGDFIPAFIWIWTLKGTWNRYHFQFLLQMWLLAILKTLEFIKMIFLLSFSKTFMMRYYYIFCKCLKYRQLPYFMICFFLQLGMILTEDSAGEFVHSSGCKDEIHLRHICKHSSDHSFHHHHDKSVWFQSHFSLETAGSSFQRIFWYFEKGLHLIWIDRLFLNHRWK